MELISSSVAPNKVSIFEEPRLTKKENEDKKPRAYEVYGAWRG